jgi:hemerythrin superfamily protein
VNKFVSQVTPSATTMIRMDHAHVMSLFHRFKRNTSPVRKQALVQNACLALEIHAQIEEEIFYPALRLVMQGDQVLDKSEPEHAEMKRVIGELRESLNRQEVSSDEEFDGRFLELMRIVIHHIADEETRLLPAAERLIADQLADMGVRMTQRRIELLKPHAGELAVSTVRSFPLGAAAAAAVLTTGAVALGAMLFSRRRSRPRDHWSQPFR